MQTERRRVLAPERAVYLSFDDDRLAGLGPYAVEFRYLGVKAPEVSLEAAEAAIDALLARAGKQIGATPC